MRHIIIMLIAAIYSPTLPAQDKLEGNMALDIVSQYIWRGQDLGNVSIQPVLGISWKGLSLNAWGSVGLTSSQDTKELDLTLAYATHGFNIGVTDYWFNQGGDVRGHYFAYTAHHTNHIFEANIGYDFGFLSLQWYTNFAGNDYLDYNGKHAYSSYFEVSAPFRLVTCDWNTSVGVSPYASTLYGNNKFAVTNITLKATKTFDIKQKVSIPIYLGITVNPQSSKAYFWGGIAVQPNLQKK